MNLRSVVFCGLFALAYLNAPAQSSTGDFKGYEKLGNQSFLKYHKKGNSTQVGEIGGAIFLQLLFVTENDSVFIDINEEAQTASYPMRMDAPVYKNDFLDVMGRLHVGDSITLFMSLDSLKKYFPDEFVFDEPYASMNYLGMSMRVDSMYTAERTLRLQEEAAQKRTEQRLSDSLALQKYLRLNGLPAVPNMSGMWYKETKKGSGVLVANGDSLTVHYVSQYANTQITNDDPSGDTFTYKFGVDPMRDGWDIGMAMMSQGGKAIFIMLPDPEDIDDRIMIYEVELIHVKHN